MIISSVPVIKFLMSQWPCLCSCPCGEMDSTDKCRWFILTHSLISCHHCHYVEFVTDEMDWSDLIFHNQSIKDKIQYLHCTTVHCDPDCSFNPKRREGMSHCSFDILKEFFFNNFWRKTKLLWDSPCLTKISLTECRSGQILRQWPH